LLIRPQKTKFQIPEIQIPRAFAPLYKRARYKILWGGRGSAKSTSVARYLITKAHTEKHRIACLREYQNSIGDSVYFLLKNQIDKMGLTAWFDFTNNSIVSKVTGTEFIFKGLHFNTEQVMKSLEGITIAWVEEGQTVGENSWKILTPTIRENDSEIIVTFNQGDETDATYQRFVVNADPSWIVIPVTWQDNPWFPKVLNDERLHLLKTDPEAYEWIWGLSCKKISDAIIFRNKYIVEGFETPEDARFFHGMDFGFSQDPSAIVRMFITGKPPLEDLWIDMESVGYGVDLDELPQLMNKIPTAQTWPIKADSSRPETISYLKKQGFNISEAKKWPGSVEDGIEHLRAFRKIHIHERCKHTAQEARLYSYKVDRISQDILPIIVDKHNHCWDASRYGLDGYIKRRGGLGVWEKLGGG